MRNRTVLQAVTAAVLAVSLLSSGGAEEVRYSTIIKPLFETHCVACHGQGSPEHAVFKTDRKKLAELSQGPRMDTYTHLTSFAVWPDTGALMRRLDDGTYTKDGKPGNMFRHLGSSDEERLKNLSLFRAWIGNWTLKRWPEITKEELNGIKVPY